MVNYNLISAVVGPGAAPVFPTHSPSKSPDDVQQLCTGLLGCSGCLCLLACCLLGWGLQHVSPPSTWGKPLAKSSGQEGCGQCCSLLPCGWCQLTCQCLPATREAPKVILLVAVGRSLRCPMVCGAFAAAASY